MLKSFWTNVRTKDRTVIPTSSKLHAVRVRVNERNPASYLTRNGPNQERIFNKLLHF